MECIKDRHEWNSIFRENEFPFFIIKVHIIKTKNNIIDLRISQNTLYSSFSLRYTLKYPISVVLAVEFTACSFFLSFIGSYVSNI